jgi:hypothetical protein
MNEFYANLGGIYWWLLIKFGRTKLVEEQNDKNKIRNLLFVSFVNILFVIMILLYLNN